MVSSIYSKCTTRDKLIIISLAARLGTKDWAKITGNLAKNRHLMSQSLVAITPNECRDIYNDILHGHVGDTRVYSENDTLRDTLHSLKTRRLFEIQQSLKHIAEEINAATNEGNHIRTSTSGRAGTIGFSDDNGKEKLSGDLIEVTHATSNAAAEGGNVVPKSTSEFPPTHETIIATPNRFLADRCDVLDSTHARSNITPPGLDVASSDLKIEKAVVQDTETESKVPGQSNVISAPTPVVNYSLNEQKPFKDPELKQLVHHNRGISKEIAGDVAVTESISHVIANSVSNAHTGQSVVAEPEEVTTPITAESIDRTQEFAIGANRSATSMADEQQLRNWKKNIAMVWRDISGHRFGGMFLSPIKSSDAPHYYEVIRQPLDLKTIKNRIRDEEITTTVEFYRDIMHMLMNALMYNSEDTEVYQMTMEILPDAQACVEQLLQTEAVVNQPKDSTGSSGTTEVAINANVVASNKDEEDTRNEDHDGDDSDASAPTKRKRRVASERASKNLRA